MNRTRELVKRWNGSGQQEMGTTFGIEIGIGKPENRENEKRKSEIRNQDQKNENRKYENTSRIRKTNSENLKIRKTKNENTKNWKIGNEIGTTFRVRKSETTFGVPKIN